MWGSGIFGDNDVPKKIDLAKLLQLDDDEHIKVSEVAVGGNFTVIKDTDGTVYSWGAEYCKEISMSRNSKRTVKVPKKILAKSDNVRFVRAGGYFAYCVGQVQDGVPQVPTHGSRLSNIDQSEGLSRN
jgi:alpha-tubulin suppressor-like RCC1 family protein